MPWLRLQAVLVVLPILTSAALAQGFGTPVPLHTPDIQILLLRADDRMKHFDWDGAIQDYDTVLMLDPKCVAALKNRGNCWIGLGQNEKAKKDLTEATRQDPNDKDAFLYRVAVWIAKGDYDAAIRDYSEALRLDPADYSGLVLRAMTQDANKDYDKALEDYATAIRLRPNDGFAFFERADSFYRRREYGKAIKDFEIAARLSPENVRAPECLAWLLATCPVEKYRNGKRAVELARRAIESEYGAEVWAFNALAAAYAETGQFDEAAKWQKKALDGMDTDLYREEIEQGRHRLKLYEAKKPCREEP
jgi:tetratricopeptide (TPR) repeat protein